VAHKNDLTAFFKGKKGMKRWLPLLVLLILFFAAYFLGLGDYLSFDYLKKNRSQLLQVTYDHPFLSPFLFILLYTSLIAISFPGGAFLTLTAGFLFGQPMSTIYAVCAATTGALVVFLAARYAFKDFIRLKLGSTFEKFEKEFEDNGAWYLLMLRLVPLFPFWVVNIAPAALKVSSFTFFWTTCLGIIPGTFVYAEAGTGLGAVFDNNEEFSLQALFNWHIKIALIALAFFALIPIAIKKWKKKKNDRFQP
jgi:uncharacterized membrane protein YdjX (TVP38/TMEM64 family)